MKRICLISLTVLAFITSSMAQVTIGSAQAPNKDALLDLKDSGTYTMEKLPLKA